MRKISRILTLVIMWCILSMFSGCDYFESIEYPLLDSTDSWIIYQDKKYLLNDNIGHGEIVVANYYLNYNELRPVGRVSNGILPKGYAYISDLDDKGNCLRVEASATKTGLWIEENFEFPNIYETEIENIFIQLRNVDGAEKVFLPLLQNEETFYDIIDSNVSHMQIQNDERVGMRCFFELKGYKFLKVCGYYLLNVEEKLYVTPKIYGEQQNDSSIIAVADCYRIKDEYQEMFRNAIEELNEMQA